MTKLPVNEIKLNNFDSSSINVKVQDYNLKHFEILIHFQLHHSTVDKMSSFKSLL